jgi:uncharacterized protein YfdQ (DUF2303 family)
VSDLTKEAIELIQGTAIAGIGPQAVPKGNVPYVLVPSGYTAKPMPELVYNEHSATPERIKQSVTVLDTASFINYHGLFADPNSRVFADEAGLKIVGVLDYHAAGEGSPRWGSHKVTLALRQSEEWKVWLGQNNRAMTQQQFAEYLEQNSIDVIKPSPANMMEIANDLQATTEVEFAAGNRQQDGQVRFKYVETTKTTTGAGKLDVPERFTISIPPFVGSDPVPMDALLRFRVKEGKLTFHFTLVRPEAVLRTAFQEAVAIICMELKITVIAGSVA